MSAPSQSGSELTLTTPIQYVTGVGPRRVEAYARLGITIARDLFYFFPRDYQDLTQLSGVGDLEDETQATMLGTIEDVSSRSIGPRRSILEVTLKAEDGVFTAIWFNQPFLEKRFTTDSTLLVSGKFRLRNGRWEVTHPHNEYVESDEESVVGRLLPVYPLTEGIRQGHLRATMRKVLEACLDEVDEVIPDHLLKEWKIVGIREALAGIHLPTSHEELKAARERLVYQELLLLQLGLGLRRGMRASVSTAPSLESTAKIDARIRRRFPFALTEGQNRAIADLTEDLVHTHPMNRLLQGDVGSGKTVVALYATLLAVAHGYQVAIMAPTEVLARQHARVFGEFLAKSRVRTELLIGGMGKSQHELVVAELAQGAIDVVIGTHALVQPDIEFENLGLVIIDEQHKFGVRQRAGLKDAGPHYLVMTATPIPRTVTMTLFGDLDVTTLTDAPPGRQPIHTYLPSDNERVRWWEFFNQQIMEGRQGYVVAPLIEDSELWDVASLNRVYEELSNGVLSDRRIAMLHGRLSAREKESVMQDFYSGKTEVLISTTVIEVGVDVPNASLMAIEGAERFGLAQLHQLRGRVGRGKYPGYCALFGDLSQEATRERLEAFTQTTNGFELAELDFANRGPGDLFGTRQHGMPPLRIADLIRDSATVERAKLDADRLLEGDPGLAEDSHRLIRERVLLRYGRVLQLGDVG